MRALGNFEQLFLARSRKSGCSLWFGRKMDEARQVIAELDNRHPNFTVQLYRQMAYAVSTDQQYRRGVDDILDGLGRAGVPEQ